MRWEDSRFDIFGEGNEGDCFIEVKNVSMKEGDLVLFPDARTERGKKHLNTLVRAKRKGFRAEVSPDGIELNSFLPVVL